MFFFFELVFAKSFIIVSCPMSRLASDYKNELIEEGKRDGGIYFWFLHVQGEARVLVETMRNGTEKQRLQLAKALSIVID